ncbi:MAG: hypothetical protein LUG66_06835 [Clostridiales bacterium]|nr:hypothetical protein [Clostridiales bacterium]
MKEKIIAIIEKIKKWLPYIRSKKMVSILLILLIFVLVFSAGGCCSWGLLNYKYKSLYNSYNELNDSYDELSKSYDDLSIHRDYYRNKYEELLSEVSSETVTETTTETTTENHNTQGQVELLQFYFDCLDNIDTYTYETVINKLQTMSDTNNYTLKIEGGDGGQVYLYNTEENYLWFTFYAKYDDETEDYLPQSQDGISFLWYQYTSDIYIECDRVFDGKLVVYDADKNGGNQKEVSDSSEQLEFIKSKSNSFKNIAINNVFVSDTEKENILKQAVIDVVGEENFKTINYVPLNNFTLIEFNGAQNLTDNMIIKGMYLDICRVLEAIQPTINTDVDINVYFSLTDTYGNSNPEKVIASTFKYETIQKINYENVSTDNIPVIADEWWDHPAIRN